MEVNTPSFNSEARDDLLITTSLGIIPLKAIIEAAETWKKEDESCSGSMSPGQIKMLRRVQGMCATVETLLSDIVTTDEK